MAYYVYMIKNKQDVLYVGVSENPLRRLVEHNSKRGSVATHQGTYKIVFLEECESLTQARTREIQIKKWRRNKKEFLIQHYKNGLPTKVEETKEKLFQFYPTRSH